MYVLTITRESYSRTDSGKSWRSKPDETEIESFPWFGGDFASLSGERYGEDVHHKITDSDTLWWFRRIGGSEHAERSYTPVGYIVTRLVSTNPDRTLRIVRKFRITDV
jgi:hypothetical protein